jgi:hypothetical protein
MKEERPLWNPYLAGFVLGLVLLFSFVVTGRGLGASGAVSHVQAAVLHAFNPTWAEFHPVIGKYFAPGVGAFGAWIVFVVLGVFLGGLVGSITGGRFRIETVHGPRTNRDVRWILAVAGGALSGVAAQIARGCTSGQALTGGAQLALGSWVFMFSVFGGAYALAYFVRKQWI